MPKTYVLYHGGCSDGFCAAWVAHGVLGDSAEYIPVNYGQAPPEMEAGATVYILDLSYKRAVMLGICRRNTVIVLDHHRTAEAELAGLAEELMGAGYPAPRVTFDMAKSGGRLAWERFHGDKPAPWLVDYTEARDLWTWHLPYSREVNAALRSYPMDFATWDKLEESIRNDHTGLRTVQPFVRESAAEWRARQAR
jgi:oligoribonuclease NrnB/cAMP/cGMP phosphodiesterase (DHH superfamily)